MSGNTGLCDCIGHNTRQGDIKENEKMEKYDWDMLIGKAISLDSRR